MAEPAPSAVAQSFLTVQVGDERFALPASDIAEVIRFPTLTRVPLGPSSLLGVANLRGAVMPVVSLHSLLGRAGDHPANARVVVVDRGSPVGLVIDRIASLDSGKSTGDAPAQPIDLDGLLAKGFVGFGRRGQSGPISLRPEARARTAAAPDEIALVCFSVAGQDYALSLASVYEVVAQPESVAVVPQTDAVMLGAMTMRSRLLPLVSLRGLLGLREGGHGGSRPRVVVARIGDALVGLAVDGMKEILRIPASAIDPVPALLTRSSAEARIQGICRLDGGQRLVSVLSTENLFRDQAIIEQIAQQKGTGHEMNSAEGPSKGDEQFVVFQLGGDEYGLPIGAVEEVVRVPDTLTRLPKAPAFIEGVMNLRGRVVPVIDQRRRFRLDRNGERRRERIVVVSIDHMQAGFVVDTVSEILNISRDQLRPTPELVAEGGQVIDRIANIEIEGRMILLLNPGELLDRAEKDLLAAIGGHMEPPAS